MTTILLIRHATTDAVGKRLAGRSPGVHLNNEGQAQAAKLAERLTGLPVSAVYSSPLERTLETAEPLARALGLETRVAEDFVELDFGEWTNRAIEELSGDEAFRRFNVFRSCTRVPGGETMLEAQARFVAGLQKLCGDHHGQAVAVVSHSDMIKAAVAYYAGIHLDMFQRIEISPASVSIITIYGETASILKVNDTGEISLPV
jgi:probable phosphomutase (TIGR03848 family)